MVNEAQTLKSLLTRALEKRQVQSGRALAEVAEKNGHKIAHTTVNAILAGTYKSKPSDETIRAIGWLAGVGDEVAFTASGRRNPGPPFASELPPGVDDLSPSERRAAIEILRTLVATRQEINRYEDITQSRPEESIPEFRRTGRTASHSGASMNLDIDAEFERIARTEEPRKQDAAARELFSSLIESLIERMGDAKAETMFIVKAQHLIHEEQGSKADHELARRSGETEDEIRERLDIPYE